MTLPPLMAVVPVPVSRLASALVPPNAPVKVCVPEVVSVNARAVLSKELIVLEKVIALDPAFKSAAEDKVSAPV